MQTVKRTKFFKINSIDHRFAFSCIKHMTWKREHWSTLWCTESFCRVTSPQAPKAHEEWLPLLYTVHSDLQAGDSVPTNEASSADSTGQPTRTGIHLVPSCTHHFINNHQFWKNILTDIVVDEFKIAMFQHFWPPAPDPLPGPAYDRQYFWWFQVQSIILDLWSFRVLSWLLHS